jgi:winged helix DNA-binding protein
MNKPELAELLLSGWGALLKPTSFQGYLCFAPNQGQNVTFVSPRQWLGEWTPIDSEEALREVARRFLAIFAPATLDEFDRWFGLEPSVVKRIFRSLGDEIEEVNVEGWKGWVLAASLPAFQAAQPSGTVNLLPHFDPYTLAVARHSQFLLDNDFKGRVYRPQGWIYPVVLVDGRMAGIWEYDQQRSGVSVKVEPFAPLSNEVKQSIGTEALRLGDFLGCRVELNFS